MARTVRKGEKGGDSVAVERSADLLHKSQDEIPLDDRLVAFSDDLRVGLHGEPPKGPICRPEGGPLTGLSTTGGREGPEPYRCGSAAWRGL
jgi:hypothetical protein